jgi:uncharacterized protein (DUF111 family)
MTAQEEINVIGKMLHGAKMPSFNEIGEEDGIIDLTGEVIWSAMGYLKMNPSNTIEEACEFGLDEWIK